MGLIEAFIHKVIFPTIDADWAIFENESISLLPDLPGYNNEDLHEKATIESYVWQSPTFERTDFQTAIEFQCPANNQLQKGM